MRRVVITGMGVKSPLGNCVTSVTTALRNGTSGITRSDEFVEHGFRSRVWAQPPAIDFAAEIEKRALRFMGDGAAYAYLSMRDAIAHAGLTEAMVSNPMTGLLVGSGGPSMRAAHEAHKVVLKKGAPRRIGPLAVPKAMSSTVSACLATPYKIKGVNMSITSACATSAHCIGEAYWMIMCGRQDVMFAGGAEENVWEVACTFDAMGAISSKYNDTPERASRAFDADRDGFVIGGGAGILVLESLDHALSRGANIIAEVIGYGATSDGHDMVAPEGMGGQRAMEQAISTISEGRKVLYVNAHGTSTPAGDVVEVKAVRRVFDSNRRPVVGSTKSLSGHSLGAAGVHEAIYSLLMMQGDFIAASVNIDTLDPELYPSEIASALSEGVEHDVVVSNSFGFGGTNASLALARFVE